MSSSKTSMTTHLQPPQKNAEVGGGVLLDKALALSKLKRICLDSGSQEPKKKPKKCNYEPK